MQSGFVDAARKMGYPYYIYAPDDADTARAYQLAEAGVVQHSIVGMLQYIFDEGTAVYIQKWADMGIAVTSAHTFIDDEDKDLWPGLLAWAACSAETYGRLSANAIGNEIGGEGTVAVTVGSFNKTETRAADSFIDEMKKNFPNVNVLDAVEEGFDTPDAIQRATAIVQANPDLVGAFSTTGAGPSTWAGAQANTGRPIVSIAMDYSEINLDLVKKGEVYGLVAQPLYHAFYAATEILDKHFRGEPYEWANEIEAPLITIDNVDDYYDLVAYVIDVMKDVG